MTRVTFSDLLIPPQDKKIAWLPPSAFLDLLLSQLWSDYVSASLSLK